MLIILGIVLLAIAGSLFRKGEMLTGLGAAALGLWLCIPGSLGFIVDLAGSLLGAFAATGGVAVLGALGMLVAAIWGLRIMVRGR